MPHIRVQRSHQLSLEDIRAKASDLAQSLVNEYGGQQQWQGNNLSYKRSGVRASIACGEDEIVVDIRLKGLVMSVLSTTIEAEVTRALDKNLA